MLNFAPDWRFEAPGEGIPPAVIVKFAELISRIAAQGDPWSILEFFKTFFAGAAGIPASRSSSLSWAESDLDSFMRAAAENAPMFIEAFYDACQALKEHHPEFGVPDAARMNRVLGENATGYEIRPPNLVFTGVSVPVAIPERQPSLDKQAQRLVRAEECGEDVGAPGHGRAAPPLPCAALAAVQAPRSRRSPCSTRRILVRGHPGDV